MSEKSSKWVKVGAVVKKKNGKGVCVITGNANASNAKYKFDVQLTITDAEGNKVASVKNGLLTVSDPRKRPGITEEELAKIPASLVSELFFVENNE
jgi:hypothetical protein